MTLDELRARLVRSGKDPLSVLSTDHDSSEVAASAPSDAWRIWHHDDRFEVGGYERGRFVTTATFDSEDAACDYLADELLTSHVESQTPDQRARSEAVSDDFYAEMERTFSRRTDEA